MRPNRYERVFVELSKQRKQETTREMMLPALFNYDDAAYTKQTYVAIKWSTMANKKLALEDRHEWN